MKFGVGEKQSLRSRVPHAMRRAPDGREVLMACAATHPGSMVGNIRKDKGVRLRAVLFWFRSATIDSIRLKKER